MLKKRWLRLLLMPLVVYLLFCVGMVFLKEELIFPARGVERARQLTPPRDAVVWMQDLAPISPNAPVARIEAWFFRGHGRSAASPGAAVMCFHGNGELIDDNIDTARTFNALGISVLLVEYRGYGRSGGATKITGICADSRAWFDRLAKQPDVRQGEILTYGFSVGSGFAAQLAAARPVAALILESPFTSLPAMARLRGIYLYLSSERLATDTLLAALPAGLPILITHQVDDPIIPVGEGRRLAVLRSDAVYAEGRGGHEPLALSEPGAGRLRQFLAKFIRTD